MRNVPNFFESKGLPELRVLLEWEPDERSQALSKVLAFTASVRIVLNDLIVHLTALFDEPGPAKGERTLRLLVPEAEQYLEHFARLTMFKVYAGEHAVAHGHALQHPGWIHGLTQAAAELDGRRWVNIETMDPYWSRLRLWTKDSNHEGPDFEAALMRDEAELLFLLPPLELLAFYRDPLAASQRLFAMRST